MNLIAFYQIKVYVNSVGKRSFTNILTDLLIRVIFIAFFKEEQILV